MTSSLDPKDLVTLEELIIANMWEVAALIEVLDRAKEAIDYGEKEVKKMSVH